ncbi:hypothetical protein RDV64_15730 [Acuticoccus sp. MNP-M23]|uniref:hypothetical protein n=1 Tax=Acuticoccus sp. MNP-M23 TaxID=3072793 RepID=UPI002816602E|nr:hypothetical protein [Acuticoccus sp. MNP-M23]WMS41522.1 hypothetical protein RDV64_15730 [Acuticoccus sp. MNP-M23]
MSIVFDSSRRVFPASRLALGVDAMFRRIPQTVALPMKAWRWRHYRPECHYMRGPGPACQRKLDALAARQSAG